MTHNEILKSIRDELTEEKLYLTRQHAVEGKKRLIGGSKQENLY